MMHGHKKKHQIIQAVFIPGHLIDNAECVLLKQN